MLLLETDRDSFLKPLQAVTGIVERRHTLPILSNVLIEPQDGSLAMVATDLEIQITAQTSCAPATEGAAVTVSAKKLLDICRSLPDSANLRLETEDNRLQIKSGKSKFNLQTLPAADFPRLSPPHDESATVRISQQAFKRILGLVQYAMAQQDIRYYLNGLLLLVEENTLKVVATDGHRLSLASTELSTSIGGQQVILPRKTILELNKLLTDTDDELTIQFAQNQVKFSFANITLYSKVVDGKFPDYARVIPTQCDKQVLISRVTLLQALQRVAILSNEKFRGVRLVLTKDTLSIISNNNEQEEAQEELEISYDGGPLDIGFNVTYLLDVLSNLSDEEVQCGFGDANSSALVTVPNNEQFKYVVMPMRI